MPLLDMRATARQVQTISPRQQYAVRLLQMSSLEFATVLQDALGKNPFLEIDESAPGADEVPDGGYSQDHGAGDGSAGDATLVSPDAAPDIVEGAPEQDDRDLWQVDCANSRAQSAIGETAANLCAVASLADHLRTQIGCLRLAPRDLTLAYVITQSLDEDGYLRTPLPELLPVASLDPAPTLGEMELALERVQSLDPMGVAARDVGECLRLQMPKIACPHKRDLALSIVNKHLDLLARGNARKLASSIGAEPSVVEDVIAQIRRLDPRPGLCMNAGRDHYVVPDVVASRSNGRWSVQINPAIVPRVRLNRVYEDLFERHQTGENVEMARHLREARWTVKNVAHRFSTILDVARAIVRRQRRFLDFGPMAMKPMGLGEIAAELGIHESTVSRATNNKFMATPSGVVELSYFFSRAMISGNGTACSGIAIRGLIGELIKAESADEPFSDVDLTRRLAEQGLFIGRRTVTKYRQALGIAPVEKRRVLRQRRSWSPSGALALGGTAL